MTESAVSHKSIRLTPEAEIGVLLRMLGDVEKQRLGPEIELRLLMARGHLAQAKELATKPLVKAAGAGA